MRSLLDRAVLDGPERRALEMMLRAGPWVWPPLADLVRTQKARTIVPDGPPAAEPGSVLLVTVDGDSASKHDAPCSASLWSLHLGSAGRVADAAFTKDALRAWEDAATALPRSLPFLWAPVKQAHDAQRSVQRLVTEPIAYRRCDPPAELRGRSFGLSFVLAMASHVLGVPLPDDVAATAVVDANGNVAPVEGLSAKIAVIERHARGIRRLLVAAEQKTAASRLVAILEIVPVKSAAAAVELVLGTELQRSLSEAGSDPSRRRELVDSFFRLALRGRGAALDWTPIERGAEVCLKTWPHLDPDQRWRLQVARAVAGRHEGNRGDFPSTDEHVLRALPISLRVSVITHAVQQCADTGSPSLEEAERLADPYLVELHEAFPEQLKLHGARARLLAVTGRPEEALRIQEDLAHQWIARLEYEEVSFQLSEWYRLAGALNDRQAFNRARAIEEQIAHLGGLGITGSPYVELARCRAAVVLGLELGVGPTLRELAATPQIPAHVRHAARRWEIECLRRQGNSEAAMRSLTALRDDAARETGPHPSARRALALAELDLAVHDDNDPAASAALEKLRELEPGLTHHLLRAAGYLILPLPAYVSRFYPY